MKSQISILIATEQFLELVEFLRSNSDPRDPTVVIADAIDYWISNASWKPELLSKSSSRGYQWKNLFLPDGSEIRMQYKGAYSYAAIEGDELVYNGKPISPSTLTNIIAGSSRNAWRDLWIKRPGDTDWSLADELRASIAK
jgi:hypothetical protein